MKSQFLIVKIFIGILLLHSSCTEIYVSNPQPIDSKNINTFPKRFRGEWIGDGGSYTIGKDYFEIREYDEKNILKVNLDSSNRYLLKDDLIYIIDPDEEKDFIGGFPYEIKNDTIYYEELSIVEESLGRKAQLRKLNNKFILNLKQDNLWWTIYLFETDINKNVIIRYLKAEDLNDEENHTHIYTCKRDFGKKIYIEAEWTKKELIKMINKGAFSDTLIILSPEGKIDI